MISFLKIENLILTIRKKEYPVDKDPRSKPSDMEQVFIEDLSS